MVEITYQIFLSTLQTIALVVGIVYYLIIMRNSQRAQQQQLETRQAQLFMQVYNQYTMEKYKQWLEINTWEWEDYEDFQAKYSALESAQNLSSIRSWLEGLGVLVKSGLVPIEIVALFMTGTIRRYWEKFGPLTLEFRTRLNFPRFGGEGEYLYKTLMEYVEEHPELKT
jgi:hypothetical protein